MDNFYPIYIYFALALAITLMTLGVSSLFFSKRSTPVKYLPYESGIQTKNNLLEERFPLRHYLVGLIFLVVDIEVIFLFPWAVVAKKIGSFAFYEMLFVMAALFIGFAYVWKKGGLEWE